MTTPPAGLAWHKSSYSGTETNCVQVAEDKDWAHVRDSKLGDTSPILSFGDKEWGAFVRSVKG